MNIHNILFGILAAGAVIIGGLLFVVKKSWPRKLQDSLLALSSGFLLALTFLKLIPVSIKLLSEHAALLMLLGFSVVHFFEHTVVPHFHFGEETHHELMMSKVSAISAFIGLAIHAFFDGLSISVGMHHDVALGIMIFIAIVLHKLPEGLTVGSILLSAGFSSKGTIWGVVGIALATLVGVLSVFLFKYIDSNFVAYAFAFTAGTIIYVGATDLIPEVNKLKNRLPAVLIFIGMLLFYLTDILVDTLL